MTLPPKIHFSTHYTTASSSSARKSDSVPASPADALPLSGELKPRKSDAQLPPDDSAGPAFQVIVLVSPPCARPQ